MSPYKLLCPQRDLEDDTAAGVHGLWGAFVYIYKTGYKSEPQKMPLEQLSGTHIRNLVNFFRTFLLISIHTMDMAYIFR